jgi:hypothetical protein
LGDSLAFFSRCLMLRRLAMTFVDLAVMFGITFTLLGLVRWMFFS